MDKVLLTNVYMISFQVINFDFVQHKEIEDIVVNCTQMERKHGLQGINDSHSFVWFWQHDRPYTVGWQSSTFIFFYFFQTFPFLWLLSSFFGSVIGHAPPSSFFQLSWTIQPRSYYSLLLTVFFWSELIPESEKNIFFHAPSFASLEVPVWVRGNRVDVISPAEQ